MKLPTVATTQDEARQQAIEWQVDASELDLSYAELAEASDYFTRLGEKFDLLDEFKENGII